jgi:proteic killer suppression protein
LIVSFAEGGTEDVYHGRNTKASRATLPRELHEIAGKKLDQLDAAPSLRSLRLPGLRLEKLRGARAGQFSVRINDQYRICFRWTDRGPAEVEITDYHR